MIRYIYPIGYSTLFDCVCVRGEFHMSDQQNLNWKMRSSGQSYRFWDFTISFYSISWLHHPHPLANCMRKAFLHLHFASWASVTALHFLFPRFNCVVGVVWYLPTRLQITVAPSFLQLRNKLWIHFVGGNPGELSQRHAPCLSFTRQRLRSKSSTWSNAFALGI